jgi:4,5-DOPA dioxygenase extradiol
MTLPAIFVSHGAPTLAMADNAFTRAWELLGREITTPRAILVVSAHWDTTAPVVGTAPRLETIHDFYGFPRDLYSLRYEPPGAPEVAERAASLVSATGLAVSKDGMRGIDHGGWVPLKYLYPGADIPTAMLSIQSHLGARHHFDIGRALAPLRHEGVLVLASGGIVHNLRELDWQGRSPAPFPWAVAFNDWIASRVEAGAVDELVDYGRLAPEPRRSHPTEEHFDPFFVALGAGGAPARRIALGFDMGSLGMDAYVFGAPPQG